MTTAALHFINKITSTKPLWRTPALLTQLRHSSFGSSVEVRPLEQYPKVEVVQNAPEWKYVERLLPKAIIPKPTPKPEYPSGWRPPANLDLEKLPYLVARTKNHMVPVYLKTTHRGMRRITIIRRIEGDIWQLERDLRVVVEQERNGRLCASRVNEMRCQLEFHGDYVDAVREYLKQRGF